MRERGRGEPTHICIDCGALGFAGGYHDHGGGEAGSTCSIQQMLADSWETGRRLDDAESEVERLRGMLSAHGLDPDCSLCAAGHVPARPCGQVKATAAPDEKPPGDWMGRCGQRIVVPGPRVLYCVLAVGHGGPHATEGGSW